MKATGIVRRIDDLGRVVIPKEIRRTLRIREGDPLEIFVDRDGEVILKKFSLIGELGDFAKEYAESLYEATGHMAIICDRDQSIAVAGASKKEFLNKPIGSGVERVMSDRRSLLLNQPGSNSAAAIRDGDEREAKYTAVVLAPIISEGDVTGSVLLLNNGQAAPATEVQTKLAQAAAAFLSKQLEE